MPTRIYVGPHDEVEIAATGQVACQGQPLEVSDELAALLDEQPSNWALPTKPVSTPVPAPSSSKVVDA